MKNNVVYIEGIPFYSSTMEDFVHNEIKKRIDAEDKTFIVTANPEIVEYARNHHDYRNLIMQADYITPDGVGIIIASKILNKPLKERITGYDMMLEFLKMNTTRPLRIYMLGAEAEVIKNCAEKIKASYPNVELVGYHHGFIDIDDSQFAEKISALEPDLVLLGMGFPRQENWITKHYDKFNKGVFIGIGGSFDVFSGKLKRAPEFWIKLNLEWLYRLLKQPSRWKRMLVLPLFLLRVLKHKLLK
ncbi:WecB/TagA/CpsF family glycosyltransferase [Pradoshia sp. D12]|uniref:WecB/TagA/CpsF family glycosyltransferase n=1 Tax=Bacillaceae TaxID=186817 RepID=UPI00112B1D34|nr:MULTISPECIES: WecB/TagA/CpsF family glycosyltransferase [Bacillaceae]QFK72900.1 WecB/TagA/CpsF family glycosyltransferase [Pradoshia sp. D12]TPF71892.1 WecB/TagA/CpsF family glycosyltransferase [Bacillus sp. D12]